MTPNHSIQRMGASHSAHFRFPRQRRLAPTADAERSEVVVAGTILAEEDPSLGGAAALDR